MCNIAHQDGKPIPKKGEGWKMFTNNKHDGQILRSLMNDKRYYFNSRKWVTWEDRKYTGSYFSPKVLPSDELGFCFFLDKDSAESALAQWNAAVPSDNYKTVLVKIVYDKGIGKHIEEKFIAGNKFEIALCKKFKIHPDCKEFVLGHESKRTGE